MFRTTKLVVCFLILISSSTFADVKMTIVDGIEDNTVKERIEHTLSILLSRANTTYQGSGSFSLDVLDVSVDFEKSMLALWKSSPFKCPDDYIVESAVCTTSGYQVRNIPLLISSSDKVITEEYHEGVANFDSIGIIKSFYIALSENIYTSICKRNLYDKEILCRQSILNLFEHLQTSFYNNDKKFIKFFFDSDGFNISNDSFLSSSHFDSYKGKKKIFKKDEFLKHLKKMLSSKDRVKFDIYEVDVLRHPVNNDFYGVTIHISMAAEHQSLSGYVFQLWDFHGRDVHIHVNTWQSDTIDNRKLSKDEIITLIDFDI